MKIIRQIYIATNDGGAILTRCRFRFSVTGNFDLAKSLDKLESIQTEKLNNERSSLGGAKSDIVLIVPYTSTVPDPDKEYCLQRIQRMREQVPGNVLIVHYRECTQVIMC